MLRHKGTTIVSEIKSFFSSGEKAIYSIFTILSSLTFSISDILLPTDKCNNRYRGSDKLMLMLLFPFFEVRNAACYEPSVLHTLFNGGKDLFYRLLNDPRMPWRQLLYRLNMRLIRQVERSSEKPSGERCLIVDDTDLPKTGRRIELIGKVFSHVTHSSILAFKGLFLGYHDGTSFFGLDFSLHGEKGKNAKRPYGLSQKDFKKRYNKRRGRETCGYERKQDYFKSKIEQMISMVGRAIGKGIRFDYLLVDSWFTCFELIRFIKTRRIGCHLLGMIKMGKTKYLYLGKEMTSKEIAADLGRKKKVRRSKRLNCWYSQTTVDYKGHEVKLFFCRSSKKGSWNGLLTTNVDLDFEEAYRIYSKRWTIEVFFKESKQYLGLGRCQSQDFDAQIASTSTCLLQYNLLSVVKRFERYETIGGIFRDVQSQMLELTVGERIWLIIIEILAELSDIFEVDMEMLMEKLLSENEKFIKLLNFKPLLQAG